MIRPRRREEAARDVLGVDPAFDRVAAEDDVALRNRERLPRGDRKLLADEVEAGDRLGHGVLDLDARVHLHEEVVAVRCQETLDRAGGAVAGGAGGIDGDLADSRPERVVDGGRRRLLDELLMAPLDGAVPFPEVDDVAVRVREHLDLDVARILDVPLDVDGGVGEVPLPLAGRGVERALGLVGGPHDLHSLPATPGRGLDDHRIADLVAELHDVVCGLHGVDRPRDDGHSGFAHRASCRRLRPHQLDRVRRRPDPGQPRLLDAAGEFRVLGEEPVAGVDRLRPRAQRRLDEHLAAEVALRRGPRPDEVGLVGGANVRAPPIGLRVDRHAADPELAERAEDPDHDLAPVRDQHLREERHATRILPQR